MASDLHLMPRLRMSGALPPLSHMLTLHVQGQLYFIFPISVIFSVYVTVSKMIPYL
jgi:peptidoglycan/LPS O-acetylase OafA/YrhL